MIIDRSYFISNKETFIPNAIVQPSIGSNSPTSIQQIDEEIDARESELMVKSLGYVQWEELKSQFETNGDLKPTALQKWIDFVDGKTLDNGKRWNGLRYSLGTKKISLIAYYVFFWFLKEDYQTYTTTGMQIPKSENSLSNSPNPKLAEIWNKFVSMYGKHTSWINYNFFENWNGCGMQWNGSEGRSNEVNMYEFLSAYPDDYDISFFKKESVINSWGL